MRPYWIVLMALFCLLSPVSWAADDGLNFEADPLLQDLLKKRSQRQQQEQAPAASESNEPKSSMTGEAEAAEKKSAATKKSTSTNSAAKQSSPGIGQGIIQFQSKPNPAQANDAADHSAAPGQTDAKDVPAKAAAPKSSNDGTKSGGETLYSPEQLRQFEQASEWLKPRDEAMKEQAQSASQQKRERAAQERQNARNKLPKPMPAPINMESDTFKVKNKNKKTEPPQEIEARDKAIEVPASPSISFPAATSAEPEFNEEAAVEKAVAPKKDVLRSNAEPTLDVESPRQSTEATPITREAPVREEALAIPDSATPPAKPVPLELSNPDELDNQDAMDVEKDLLATDKKVDAVTSASVKEYLVPENEPMAVAWHRERAQQGDIDAQYNLAVIYATGFGVKQDYRSAAWWYEQAANQKNAQAQLRLGMMYIIGLGVKPSVIKGSGLIQDAANQGVSLARIISDKLLAKPIDGLDIPKAMSKVRDTFLSKNEKAASDALLEIVARAEVEAETSRKAERFNGQVTGSAAKRGTVGNHIPSFLGPAQPQTEIIVGDPLARVRRHAKEGNIDAQFEWARKLDTGNGVPYDHQQALAWYSKAATKNHSGALYYIAIAHLYGLGIPVDIPKGREMLKQAANLEQPLAQKLLSYLSDGKNDVLDADASAALAWNLDLAMNENDPDAMAALGHMFNMGWGVKQSTEEGQTWLRKSRAAGGKGADRELRRMKIDKIMSDDAKNKEPAVAPSSEESPTIVANNTTSNSAQDAQQAEVPLKPALVSSTDNNAKVTAGAADQAGLPMQTATVTGKESQAEPELTSPTGVPMLAAHADSAVFNTGENKNITRGTLPSTSPAAKKAQSLQAQQADAAKPLISRPAKQNESAGFWNNVVQRLRNLFRHDDDPIKPFFLVIMGVLLGLVVFKGLRNRDMRKYHQQEQSPFS